MQILSFASLSLMILAAVVISGCSFLLKNPDISVKRVSLTSLSLKSLSLDIILIVNNPNLIGTSLKKLSFDIFYRKDNEWVYLSHGEQTGIEIKPGVNEISIPVTVENSELLSSLASLISNREITFQIRGVASPDFFGISPPIPFTKETTISLR